MLRRIRLSLIESGKFKRPASPAGRPASPAGRYLLYAVGEILLVMLGILLALQVNNWNQHRVDHKKENLLLREINAEFLINKEELESVLRLYRRVYDKCGVIIESFPIELNSYNSDSLAALLRASSTIRDADLSEGSVSTLINSSAIELISNPELRSLLVQWQDLVADYQKAETMAIKFTVENYFPYMDENIPLGYREGIKDSRFDPLFLTTFKFENMIKRRRSYIGSMLRIVGGDEGKLMKTIDRIIELSTQIDE